MLRRQRRWLAYYATLLGFATTTRTTTQGFFLPTVRPIVERRHDVVQKTCSAHPTMRRRRRQTTEIWAKNNNNRKSKKEEDAAKRADISNSAFFQSVSGFFKDDESSAAGNEPNAEDKDEGGFFRNFRRKYKKEEPKKDSSVKESARWGLFRKESSDKESLDKTSPQQSKDSVSSNLFKEATNRVKDATSGFTSASEAAKKEIPSRNLRRQKDDDKKKQKQRRKEAKKKAKKDKEKTESPSNSLLRRVQDILPRSSNDADNAKEPESVNPLSVVQKFAGSVWKNNDAEQAKEEWVPIFPKTRIMPGEMVPVTVGGIDLLAVASNDGQSLYCIANSCPHLGTPLETGQLTRLPIEDKSTPSSSSPTTTKSPFAGPQNNTGLILSETDVSNILSQDGCEDCIVCPLHKTAFALKSGEVRGEWCPYPPVLGKLMGTVKQPTAAAVFDIRTKGKNVEVRLNSIVSPPTVDKKKDTKKETER